MICHEGDAVLEAGFCHGSIVSSRRISQSLYLILYLVTHKSPEVQNEAIPITQHLMLNSNRAVTFREAMSHFPLRRAVTRHSAHIRDRRAICRFGPQTPS